MPGQNGCESCHGPGSKHIAMAGRGGLEKFIINPGKDPEACFQCHQETRAEFHLPQHHPVIEGKMNCVQCHDPHGMDIMKPAGGLAMARSNENCAQCHREQTRPFIFEHAALREGCTVCHNPHGSINAKMLVQRDSNLCLKCHAQTQGPAGKWRRFHRQHRPHRVPSLRHLLDGRLPRGGSRLQHVQPFLFLLKRNRAIHKRRLVIRVGSAAGHIAGLWAGVCGVLLFSSNAIFAAAEG